MKTCMKCYHLHFKYYYKLLSLTLGRLKMDKPCLSVMFQDANGEENMLKGAGKPLDILMLTCTFSVLFLPRV